MLRSFPALLQRMCNIMDIETTAVLPAPLSELDKDERRQQLIECVLQSMWKFVNTYSFNSALLVTITYKLSLSWLTPHYHSVIKHGCVLMYDRRQKTSYRDGISTMKLAVALHIAIKPTVAWCPSTTFRPA